MRSSEHHQSITKRETASVAGVRVGPYVLEVGADCRSFTRFATKREDENASALAQAFDRRLA